MMSVKSTESLRAVLAGVRRWMLAIVLLGFGEAAVGQVVPIPGLFNTGVDGSGALLPPGAIDPNYAMTISADPDYPFPGPAYVVDPLPGAWLSNTATAQWINPSGEPISHFTGFYEYTLTFDLTGLDPTTAVISGAWALDDGLIGSLIIINGVSVPGSGHAYPGWLALEPFSVTTGFLTGINTLTFVTSNEPSVGLNPTGLIVHGIVGSAEVIPEPGTLTLLGILPLLGLCRRSRRLA
jgi:hypothetical protein